MTKKRIAVVGAGIAGLSCAYELKKAGHEVAVFEKEPIPGGRMSTYKKEALIFDIGANHLCDLYDDMKGYCQELDLEFLPMDFVKYGVFRDGKIHSPNKAIGFVSRMRLAIEFLRTGKHGEWLNFFNLTSAVEHDTEDAYSYMTRRIGKGAADYLVDPFSTTYQFHSSKEISLGAVKGIMELLKFKREGWYLHHIPGGMISLPQKIADYVGVTYGADVNSVTGGEQPTVNGQQFDFVVLAAPAHVTKHMLSEPTVKQQVVLDATKYASSISLAFEVDKNLLPETSVVWVPRVESATISGYTNELMKGSELVDDGKSLICAWLHEDYAKQIMEKSDEEIFAETKKELIKFCPWFSDESQLRNYDIKRWPAAMPKFYTGFLTKVKSFLEDGQGENNIFLCGDYLNSPWTEGSIGCGKRVAEDIMHAIEAPQ